MTRAPRRTLFRWSGIALLLAGASVFAVGDDDAKSRHLERS